MEIHKHIFPIATRAELEARIAANEVFTQSLVFIEGETLTLWYRGHWYSVAAIENELGTHDVRITALESGEAAINDELAAIAQQIAAIVNNSYGEAFWFAKTDGDAMDTPEHLAAQFGVDDASILNYFDFTTNTPYTATADGGSWTAGTPITPQNGEIVGISKAFFGIAESGHPGRAIYSGAKASWDYYPDIYLAPDGVTIRFRTSDGALEVFSELADQSASTELPTSGILSTILQKVRNCLKYLFAAIPDIMRHISDVSSALNSHTGRTDNPHAVTYTQAGADAAGSAASAQAAVQANLDSHTGRTDNPHAVTYTQAGADAAGAAAAVQANLDSHASDTDKHITAAERIAWNAKQAALTAAQLAAANSGVTAAKVTNYDTHLNRTDNPHAVTASQVGADPTGSAAAAQAAVQANLDSHTGDTVKHITAAERTAWNAKQAALNSVQMEAVNSGVSSTKVNVWNAHLENMTNPHRVTAAQAGADPAGTAAAVDTKLQTHANDASVHVSSSERTAWNAKQAALTAAQLNAANSGVTSAKVSNYDTHLGRTDNPHSVTAAQVGADPAGSAAAVQSNLDLHTVDTTRHLTAAERTSWSSKMTLIVQTTEPTSVASNTLVAVI